MMTKPLPSLPPTRVITLFLLVLASLIIAGVSSAEPPVNAARARSVETSIPQPIAVPTPSPTAAPSVSPAASPAASPTESPAAPAVTLKAIPESLTFMAADAAKPVDVQKDNLDFPLDVNWECKPADDLVTCTIDGGGLKVVPVKSGTTKVTVKHKSTPAQFEELEVPVTVEFTKVRISVGGAIREFDSGAGRQVSLSMFEGDTLEVSLVSIGRGEATSPIAMAANSVTGGTTSLEATVKDGGLALKANQLPNTADGSADLTISLSAVEDNQDKASITLHVTVQPKHGTIELATQGDKRFLLKDDRVTINAVVKDRNNTPRPAFVRFELVDPAAAKWVSLSQESNAGKAILSWREPSAREIASPGGGLEQRPSLVQVKATASINTATGTPTPIEGSIDIRMGEVSGFAMLKVKLNIMDDRTAADLYGSVASKEYYALTVHLFNNLQADDKNGDLRGASILAYSSSIEVAVGLEKKYNGDSRSSFSRIISKDTANQIRRTESQDAESKAVTHASDIIGLRDEFAKAIADQFATEKKAIELLREAMKESNNARSSRRREDIKKANAAIEKANVALRTARATGLVTESLRQSIERRGARSEPNLSAFPSGPNVAIDDGMWHALTRADLEGLTPLTAEEISEALLSETGEMAYLDEKAMTGKSNPAPGGVIERSPQEPTCQGVIKYRPFTFEMMVNTVDRRDERRTRTRVFNILEFVGMGTSFVTSFLVPPTGSDLPVGLEKYRNLFIPGLDKIWKNYKEQQRQNMVSQTMRTIEEIPYGSDITRVIFIPRKNIHGIMRGHDVRISEICPYYFNIQVGVIRDKATVQQGAVK